MLKIIGGKEKAAEKELTGLYFGEKAHMLCCQDEQDFQGNSYTEVWKGKAMDRRTESTCNTFITQMLLSLQQLKSTVTCSRAGVLGEIHII